MADFYTQLSASLDTLTKPQVKWLTKQLQIVELWQLPSGKLRCLAPPALPSAAPGQQATLVYRGPQCFLAHRADVDITCGDLPHIELGFECEFQAGESGKPCLWIHFEMAGNLAALGRFVQQFLKRWRPSAFWTASYSNSASRPILNGFSGGALFVTGEDYESFSANSWLRKRIKQFHGG